MGEKLTGPNLFYLKLLPYTASTFYFYLLIKCKWLTLMGSSWAQVVLPEGNMALKNTNIFFLKADRNTLADKQV